MEQKPARVRILDAAHELMRTVGLARVTTKEIARAADCSEAALYKYFPSKEELFVHVLTERLPRLLPLLGELTVEPGRGSLEDNLTRIARQAALFYEESFPITASLYAEQQLKRKLDDTLRTIGAGPHVPMRALDGYLRAEAALGRIRPDADTSAAAALLLGACVQRVFSYEATETGERPPVDAFAARVARTLLGGLSVAEEPARP